MPRGMRDLGRLLRSATARRRTGYLLLLTDRYPSSDPALVRPGRAAGTTRSRVRVTDTLERSRLPVLFRLLLLLPHLVWFLLWTSSSSFAGARRLARRARDRPGARVRCAGSSPRTSATARTSSAFGYMVGGPFPGFTGAEGSYPVDITIEPARAPAAPRHALPLLPRAPGAAHRGRLRRRASRDRDPRLVCARSSPDACPAGCATSAPPRSATAPDLRVPVPRHRPLPVLGTAPFDRRRATRATGARRSACPPTCALGGAGLRRSASPLVAAALERLGSSCACSCSTTPSRRDSTCRTSTSTRLFGTELVRRGGARTSASSSSTGCSARSCCSPSLWLYARRGVAFMQQSAAGPIGTGMLLGMLGLGIVWIVQLPFGLARPVVGAAARHDRDRVPRVGVRRLGRARRDVPRDLARAADRDGARRLAARVVVDPGRRGLRRHRGAAHVRRAVPRHDEAARRPALAAAAVSSSGSRASPRSRSRSRR